MPSSPITLDSLLSLSISENYFDVFDHIHSPQLVTLRITQEYRFGDFSLKPIVAFINRCDLHITSFRSNAYFDDEPGTLAEFLRVMASLRRLRARYLLIPDDLLIEIGKGSLLPILGELEIQVKPTMAFANAITSRYEITGWNGLRFARGHYPASCANDSNSAVNVANSIQTFAEFNASYGTNFKLVGTLEEDR
ncbi:hypothetical protein H0H92_000321 [Tricholoma furcatifolium]|nr:hypothetical protein H0H92_000321 [Tricholoma furcatifolium]